MQENATEGWPDAYLVQDEAALPFTVNRLTAGEIERLAEQARTSPLMEWAHRVLAAAPQDAYRTTTAEEDQE